MRSHGVGIDRGHDRHGIADLRRIPTVPADNTEYLRSNLLGVLCRTDKIWTDVLFQVASAHRKYEERIDGLEAAHLQPLYKNRFPALVIDPCCQFGNIVGRRISLYPDNFPEVIDRMTAVSGAATDPKKEQSATAIAKLSQN